LDLSIWPHPQGLTLTHEKHLLNPNPMSLDRVRSGLGKVRPG